MKTAWNLVRTDTGACVVRSLEVADTAWSRFRGLQWRAGLAPGSGLLLVPCASVHTFFMRFAIDVLLLDRAGTVLAVRPWVRPWRVVWPVRQSYAVLELPGGSCDLPAGTTLRLESTAAEAPLRWSLAFLRPLREVR